MRICTDKKEGNAIVPVELNVDNVLFFGKDVSYKITVAENNRISILKQTGTGSHTIKVIPIASNLIEIE